MTSDEGRPKNRQAGIPLRPANDPAAERVATGSRADEARLVPDPDQIVKAQFAPEGDRPRAPQEQTEALEAGRDPRSEEERRDAAEPPPSVWDARPVDRDS